MDGQRMIEKEKGRKGRTNEPSLSLSRARARARIESELDLRLRGIKTFETSTGQQDRLQLNHSSSAILLHSSFLDMLLPPFFPLCLFLLLFLSSLLSPLSLSLSPSSLQLPRLSLTTHSSGPIGSGVPHPLFVFSEARLRLLPFAPPLSCPDLGRPLGFTWRALMTSRNERVPPPSNKRLFHVPMLILRESRFPFPLPLSLFLSLSSVSRFFVPHIAYAASAVRNKDAREKKYTLQ